LTGTSPRASRISSAASLGSSKPTNAKNRIGAVATKMVIEGEKSRTRTTCTRTPATSTIRPMLNEKTLAATPVQMNSSEKRYFAIPLSGVKKELNAATAVMVKVPPNQMGLDIQY